MQVIVEGETYVIGNNGVVEDCPYNPIDCMHMIYGMCPQVGKVTPLRLGLTQGILCKKSKDNPRGQLTAAGDRIV